MAYVPPIIQDSVPTTGNTVVGNSGRNVSLVIDPAGTLATLTINFPSSPENGDVFSISTSQILTTLTLANGTIVGTVTTLGVGGFANYIYSNTYSKWFRK